MCRLDVLCHNLCVLEVAKTVILERPISNYLIMGQRVTKVIAPEDEVKNEWVDIFSKIPM